MQGMLQEEMSVMQLTLFKRVMIATTSIFDNAFFFDKWKILPKKLLELIQQHFFISGKSYPKSACMNCYNSYI